MDAAAWTGPVGDVWAQEWRRTDRSFAGLDPALLAAILAVAPERAGRFVDIGCGAGATSLALADARLDAEVIGIDLSAGLVAAANGRAYERGNASFRQGDAVAAIAGFAPVDLFVSRHGVMFFADPVAVFTAFAEAAAPGATIVFSCFAERAANRWASLIGESGDAGDGPGPFAFADPARVAAILAAAGWRAEAPQRIDYGYVAGAGTDPVADAVGFFGRIGPAAGILRDAPDDAARAALLARLTQACAAHRDGDRIVFPAAAWIWTAHLAEDIPA